MINNIINILKKLLPENNFSRNVSLLMGGTIIVQLIQLMVMPILTRLYTPDAFGVFASFSAVVALLSIITSFSYEHAIPIPRREKEAIGLVRLSFLLLSAMVFILIILLFFYGDYFLIKFNLHSLIAYKYVLVLAIFAAGSFKIFNSFAIREREFKELSIVSIYKSLMLITVQISASSLNVLGLVFGFLIGSVVGVFRLKKIYTKRVKVRRDSTLRMILLSSIVYLKKYYKFPLYNMPNTLLNSIGRELPVILLTVFFSPTIAGFFYLANRVTQQPVSLVGGAIANVVKGHVPSIYRNGDLASFYLEINQQLLKIFAIPLAILAACLPYVFIFIFGEEWKEAGLISSILIPWVFMISLVSPVSTIPQLLGKQEIALVFEIILLILRVGGFSYGVYYNSYIIAISFFSIGAVVGIFIKMLWIAKISSASINKVLVDFFKETLSAIFVFIVLYKIIAEINFYYSVLLISIVFSVFSFRSLNALIKGSSFG